MKIYVYTALHYCYQNKELKNISDISFFCGEYITTATDNIIVKDILLFPLFRIFQNIVALIGCFCADGSLKNIAKERVYIRKNNKDVIGMLFSPLFLKGKEIEFKLIECNENTVLKVYRTKNNDNFYYEIINGRVETVYNGKKRE